MNPFSLPGTVREQIGLEDIMKVWVAVGMSLIVLGTSVKAQMRFEQSESRAQNLPVSYDAVALFSGDSSKQLVNIHYRIGQNFFIFVRNEEAGASAEYVSAWRAGC